MKHPGGTHHPSDIRTVNDARTAGASTAALQAAGQLGEDGLALATVAAAKQVVVVQVVVQQVQILPLIKACA